MSYATRTKEFHIIFLQIGFGDKRDLLVRHLSIQMERHEKLQALVGSPLMLGPTDHPRHVSLYDSTVREKNHPAVRVLLTIVPNLMWTKARQ